MTQTADTAEPNEAPKNLVEPTTEQPTTPIVDDGEVTEKWQIIDTDWIAQKVSENPSITIEQGTEWYTEAIKKAKSNGLAIALKNNPEQLEELIKSTVNGDIQENITPEPVEFDLMVLGPYPERIIYKKRRVEIVALAAMDEGNEKFSTLTAWEDFANIKNNIDPLETYKTNVSFGKEGRDLDSNRFKLNVEKDTVFSENTTYELMPYEKKLELLQDAIPLVQLGTVEQNLSLLDGKYTDPLSLRRIIVTVISETSGIGKDGNAWAKYQVVDSTFKTTLKQKGMTVWVDASIHERLQAGKGSFLEIFGMIQKSNNGQITMSACFVHALSIEPLEDNEPQIKTDIQTPQILVSTSDGM